MIKVFNTVLSSSDSYQEIEATLTEMESCMKLLSPEFDLTDTQSRIKSFKATSECLFVDEQPCCSKDLVDDGKETIRKERQEKRRAKEHLTEQDERRHIEEGGGKKIEMEQDKEEEEDEEEDEEDGHTEDEGDSFPRSSGLISYSYSLDLSISRGGLCDLYVEFIHI